MICSGETRTKAFRFSIRLVLFFLLGVLPSCAGVKATSDKGETSEVLAGQVGPDGGMDPRQEAYIGFMMSSIHKAEGQYEEAKDCLTDAMEKDPDSVFLNGRMALLLKALKDYKGAVAYAERCVELDPEDVEGRVLLAEIYALAGDEDSAIGQYERALEMEPEDRKVRLILTTILIRKGLFDAALAQLDVLIQQDPSMAIAHYYAGRIYLEQGKFAESEKAYLESLKLNRRMEPSLFDLGTLYQMQEKYEKAAEVYRRLLTYYPLNDVVRERLINIYFELGEEKKAEEQMEEIKRSSKPGDPGRQALGLIYLRHGRLDESITELDLIVSAWPEDDKSRFYLATAYEEREDLEGALEHFAAIPEKSKYFVSAQVHRAYILNRQEKPAEAIDVLQAALRSGSQAETSEVYLMLASLYEANQEYEKAMGVVEDGLRRDERNVDLIFRLGVLIDKSGDKQRCVEQMRKILEIKPDHADSLNYIGYTYAEQGIRLDEAMELIQKALKIKPDSGYIVDSLGWVYYQKGMYDEALGYLEKAVSLTPSDPTITEHLADILFKKKDYKKSFEAYQRALTLDHPDEEKIRAKIEAVRKLLPESPGP